MGTPIALDRSGTASGGLGTCGHPTLCRLPDRYITLAPFSSLSFSLSHACHAPAGITASLTSPPGPALRASLGGGWRSGMSRCVVRVSFSVFFLSFKGSNSRAHAISNCHNCPSVALTSVLFFEPSAAAAPALHGSSEERHDRHGNQRCHKSRASRSISATKCLWARAGLECSGGSVCSHTS